MLEFAHIVVGDKITFRYSMKDRSGTVVRIVKRGAVAIKEYLTLELEDGSYKSFSKGKIRELALAEEMAEF